MNSTDRFDWQSHRSNISLLDKRFLFSFPDWIMNSRYSTQAH